MEHTSTTGIVHRFWHTVIRAKGFDVGMLDGVAEPFELNANYYTETDKQAKTWNRYTVIDTSMVGKTYSVYNGSGFVPVTPTTENIEKKLIDLAMKG